jgi:uncharacterized protein (UPF0335 family)
MSLKSVADQLRSLVSQVERVDADMDALRQDKSEFYKAAKQGGLNVAAAKAVIAERRKLRQDAAAFQVQADMMTLYRQYLLAPTPTPAREGRQTELEDAIAAKDEAA